MKFVANTDLPKIGVKNEYLHHPWIFKNEIELVSLPPGSQVDFTNPRGRWIARGHYNAHARIAGRVLTTSRNIFFDGAWLEQKLTEAIGFRTMLGILERTNAYRIFHSEGDGMSGMVLDRYGDLFVAEILSAGMYRLLPTLREILEKKGHGLYAFSKKHVQKQESFDFPGEPLPAPQKITENGFDFWVSPGVLHKTGFFLDQRENRLKLSLLSKDKKVLDLCSHTGGFAISAKLGGAKEVTAIDLDGESISQAKENAKLNGAKVQFLKEDIVEFLEKTQSAGERYDIVVLDPPRQLKNLQEKGSALKRYVDFNRQALQVLEADGILVTCSCSGLISQDEFIGCVSKAASHLGKTLQIFEITGAGADHPVYSNCLESSYLKCVWARARIHG